MNFLFVGAKGLISWIIILRMLAKKILKNKNVKITEIKLPKNKTLVKKDKKLK